MSSRKRLMGGVERNHRKRLTSTSSSSSDASHTSSDLESEECEAQGCFQLAGHPLMNNLILKTLFGFMTAKDLKVCRLVCKFWNIESLPFCHTAFIAKVRYRCPGAIEHFLREFKSNTLGVPITRFRLASFDYSERILQKFLQRYAKTVTKVDLSVMCNRHGVKDLARLLRSTPNLQSLKMPDELVNINGTRVKLFPDGDLPDLSHLKTLDIGFGCEHTHICPTFYDELLCATKTKKIYALFTHDTRPLKGERDDGLYILKIFEGFGRELPLEILSLSRINVEHLDVIRKMTTEPTRLKLKHFSVNFWGPETEDNLFELMTMLKDNLISLHIFHNKNPRGFFPRMPKLKLLNFTISRIDHLIDFRQSFPALEHLTLYTRRQCEFFRETDYCPTLQSLNIRRLSLTLTIFRRLPNFCPNLTELQVSISVDSEEILRVIWTEFPQLQKLYVSGWLSSSADADSLFAGILTERVNGDLQLDSKLASLESMTPEVRGDTILKLIEENGARPSIRNLADLRDLTLHVSVEDSKGHKTYLTDVTGYLGLYALKNLLSLNVSDCTFSEACCKALVEDLGIGLYVIQLPEGGGDIIPSRCNSTILTYEDDLQFPSPRFTFKYAL